MSNNNRLPSLDKLQAKIDVIKKSKEPSEKDSYGSDMSQATRIVTDLSAGFLMGLGIGYLVDEWFYTKPWGMIVGIFVGMAAGVKNMLNSAKIIDKELEQEDKKDDNNI